MREGGGRVPGGVRGVRETYGTTMGEEILQSSVWILVLPVEEELAASQTGCRARLDTAPHCMQPGQQRSNRTPGAAESQRERGKGRRIERRRKESTT